MNKGILSGVLRPNSTNNNPSTALFANKELGGVLRFYPNGITPTFRGATSMASTSAPRRAVPNLYVSSRLVQSFSFSNIIGWYN